MALVGSAVAAALLIGGWRTFVADHRDGPLWASSFQDGRWPASWSPYYARGAGNATLVPTRDGKVLEVRAPASNDGFTGPGVLVRSNFSSLGLDPMEDAHLAYSVFLPGDWRAWAGGKLPGLGGAVGTEVAAPGGGEFDGRGWSARLMWRAARPGEAPTLQTYLYVQAAGGTKIDSLRNEQNGRLYGINIVLRRNAITSGSASRSAEPLRLRLGAWNRVEIRTRLNTPGRADGIFTVWVNGELGVDLRDVVYRLPGQADLEVDRLLFDSFYGGPTSNRAPESWYFDDVVLDDQRHQSDDWRGRAAPTAGTRD